MDFNLIPIPISITIQWKQLFSRTQNVSLHNCEVIQIPTALCNQMKRFGRALLNLYLQDRIYKIMWKNFDRQSFRQIFSKLIFVLNVMVQLNSLIERSKNTSNDQKMIENPTWSWRFRPKLFFWSVARDPPSARRIGPWPTSRSDLPRSEEAKTPKPESKFLKIRKR